jgi:Pyruvate/2-oxoacid:ferredoxin oxidoreductase gamma subunit
MKHTFAVSIGGAAGQGVATPGNIFARIFAGAACTSTPTMHINPLFGADIPF